MPSASTWFKSKKRSRTINDERLGDGLFKSQSQASDKLPDCESRLKETEGLFVRHDCGSDISTAVDIIAVHGLNGHWHSTWTEGKDGRDNNWLEDFLPKDLAKMEIHPRIMCFGYDSKIFFTKTVTDIDDAAMILLDRVYGERQTPAERSRPIVFIAHSLGGIVVKKAIILAHNLTQQYSHLLDNIKGVVFLGVPHRGADIASWATIASRILKVVGTNPKFTSDLKRNSREFASISKLFVQRAANLQSIRTFYETKTMYGQLVVDKDSAVLGLPNEISVPLEGNHQEIAKVSSSQDQIYIQLRNHVRGLLSDVSKEGVALRETFLDQTDKGVLKTLAFPEMHDRRARVDNPHPHTCQWIFAHDKYVAWTERNTGLLWIKGKPGAGKSTLMAHIYHAITQATKKPNEIHLEFFFNARGVDLQKSQLGMLRSLLNQLYIANPAIRTTIRDRFRLKNTAFGSGELVWSWTRQELEPIFLEMAISSSRQFDLRIFIDALDEAGSDHAQDITTYIHRLNDQIASVDGNAKICISSRHYPIISTGSNFEIVVEKNNTNDITSFIRDTLQTNTRATNEERQPLSKYFNARESRDLVGQVTEMSQGIFQWARIVTPMVRKRQDNGESQKEINSFLKDVPQDLESVYKYVLEHIVEVHYRVRTLLLFQWISLAGEPLSVTDLRYAMGFSDEGLDPRTNQIDNAEFFVQADETMKTRITALSGGLLEVYESREHPSTRGETVVLMVQFIHQSVQDFTIRIGLMLLEALSTSERAQLCVPNASEVMPRAHGRLFRACMRRIVSWTILNEGDKDQVKKRLSSVPFGGYAVKQLPRHARQSREYYFLADMYNDHCDLFKTVCSKFPGTPESRYRYLHFTLPEELEVFQASILFGITPLVRDLHKSQDIDKADDRGNTCLIYACVGGHVDISSMLLDAGASPNLCNERRQTPLTIAAKRGDELTVRLLIKAGATINNSHADGPNVLYEAVESKNESLCAFLILRGADVNVQGGRYGNALQAACRQGSEQIVELLLKAGADVNAQGGTYGNALQAACSIGSEQNVELLLKAGADVNAQGGVEGNALTAAVTFDQAGIVHILLKRGANPNIDNKNILGTPLEIAVGKSSEYMVQLLIQHDADPNIHGRGSFGTALLIALGKESREMVELLLQRSADPNVRGSMVDSAYWGEVMEESIDMIHYLQVRERILRRRGQFHGTPLEFAIRGGRKDMVELLIQYGADPTGLEEKIQDLG